MYILVLILMWIITIPICYNSAKKIKGNLTVSVLVGIFLPIIGAIIYAYLASNKKNEDGNI